MKKETQHQSMGQTFELLQEIFPEKAAEQLKWVAQQITLNECQKMWEDIQSDAHIEHSASYMWSCLDRIISGGKTRALTNRKWVEEFKREHGWQQLDIQPVYAELLMPPTFPYFSFDLEPEDLQNQIKALWKSWSRAFRGGTQ